MEGTLRDARYPSVNGVRLGSDPRGRGYSAASALAWSQAYEVPIDSSRIIGIQNRIATQVARTVADTYGVMYRAAVTRGEDVSNQTLSSFDCLLRYRAYIGFSRTEREHLKVRSCLEATVAREPGFALAWATLAVTYLDELRSGANVRKDGESPLLRAERAARG